MLLRHAEPKAGNTANFHETRALSSAVLNAR